MWARKQVCVYVCVRLTMLSQGCPFAKERALLLVLLLSQFPAQPPHLHTAGAQRDAAPLPLRRR